MTSGHSIWTRRYALGALVVGALWLGEGAPASADDSWSPRAMISDEEGARHEGMLQGFALEVKGHPTVSPTDRIELNEEARRTSDLTGVRLTWTASPIRGADTLAVSFEFADGSVVEPKGPREGTAPVTALSFIFAEDGRDPVSWTFQSGQPLRSPFGRITRIDVVAKRKGEDGVKPKDEDPVRPKGEEGDAGRAGQLFVLIFEDTNGNGQRDRGEVELPGWEYTVTGPDGVSSKRVTARDGAISVKFPAGRYTIVDAGQEGWTATTKTTKILVLTAGGKASVAFGNRKGGGGGRTLPPGVVVNPAKCDCLLGALPTTNAIVLRWYLCPVATSVANGEPRLYRADHGVGNWQRVHTSTGVPGVLLESSLDSLSIAASDRELFRDIVRRYMDPMSYAETSPTTDEMVAARIRGLAGLFQNPAFVVPPPPGAQTAAELAVEIHDFAYLVLVTRFGLSVSGMEAIGLGILDTDVSNGSLYDYVLTIWTPQVEMLCSRADNVGPLSPPATPVPTSPGAEVLRTRMPDLPGARRPDPDVTPIAVTWTSPLPASNPPAPPYAEGAFKVVAFVVERKDGQNGAWTRVGEGPILEVERASTDVAIPLTGDPSAAPPGCRYLDTATEDHHTYGYRISSLDLIGRTSTPTATVSATAFAIPAPLPWRSFTASWNRDQNRVDVVLTLKEALPSNRQLWVERTCPTDADPEAGLVRLNPTAWTGAALSFSLTDATGSQEEKYVYKIVIDGPDANTTIDMNLRAMVVIPDLTPPDLPPPLQFLLRPGTPLPEAVTDALIHQAHEDQNDKGKWDAKVAEVTGEIALEMAELQKKTVSSTETVVIARPGEKIEVSLDDLEETSPDFAAERLPYPPRAELVYKNGDRVEGVLQELDIDGPAISCHLLPDRAPIVCDGRTIPWDEVNSISLLWKVSQPNSTDSPRRIAFPWITDTNGDVAFPKVLTGTEHAAASLKTMHVKLAISTGAGSPDVTWDFDVDQQVPGAREIRSIRLLDTPWRRGTPGETFSYLWSRPDRLRPPEGKVTKVEIDQTFDTRAPRRKAKVTGFPLSGSGSSSAWTVQGHLVSLGVVTMAGGQSVELPLNANLPGKRVTIDSKEYSLDDLIRAEIAWESSPTGMKPVRVTLTFHHQAELRPEDLPTWLDADIKARALSLIEKDRFDLATSIPGVPTIRDAVEASREGVILYWSYLVPSDASELAGFNVYRATGDAPAVFTRINPEPIPVPVGSLSLDSLPAGSWPPANAGTGTLCWFEDRLLGGVGSEYYYQVSAVDASGLENPPAPLPTGLLVNVPDRAGPRSPVLVSIEKQHAPVFGVVLKWRTPQHAYDVVVFRREAGSGAQATAVPASATDSTDGTTSLVDDVGPFLPLKSYEYFLCGMSGGTPGKPSATRTVQILAEDLPPVASPPTATTADGSVTLSWEAPTLPTGVTAKHYIVERREHGAPSFRLRAGPLTATTFVDDRVAPDKTYDYRVVLIDGNGVQWLSVYAPVLGVLVPQE